MFNPNCYYLVPGAALEDVRIEINAIRHCEGIEMLGSVADLLFAEAEEWPVMPTGTDWDEARELFDKDGDYDAAYTML